MPSTGSASSCPAGLPRIVIAGPEAAIWLSLRAQPVEQALLERVVLPTESW